MEKKFKRTEQKDNNKREKPLQLLIVAKEMAGWLGGETKAVACKWEHR